MANIILCNLSDKIKTINEAKYLWTLEVLKTLGVPEETLNLNDIRELRYFLEGMGIEVELCTDGSVLIYKREWHEGKTKESSGWLPAKEENLIAHWKEPNCVRRIEGKDVYYEIHLNEWSIKGKRKTSK